MRDSVRKQTAGEPVVSPFPSTCRREWRAPSDEECFGFWDLHAMPEHIRKHSQLVADVATAMARRAEELGATICVQAVRASALLHDLAKAYTIAYGGNHSQIGAAWALELTGNPQVSHGIIHHVHWPFEQDPERHFLPLAVLYGDKRVRHDSLVSVTERFEDLFKRYGLTEEILGKIRRTMDETLALEQRLNEYLKVDLNACAFDRGRLVQRA